MLTYDAIVRYLFDQSASTLVALHNTHCKCGNHMEDYIYRNTIDRVKSFLPSDPYVIFCEGMYVQDTYNPSDVWLQVDDYGHIATTSDPVNRFLFVGALANWLDSMAFDDMDELEDYIDDVA